ncbi:type II toxin-antitoxin system RelE/ParE family toxin [Solimonas sp. K1W22B-7]|uniref:type II toxin-antitoxin system RelE/ParE family toxin n=1 Tax=Solimonas sp. K1W22B-7 TaxID=2303331 RepID=UPI000E332EB7|nr:type II toxin-antitoxin system RelE/ParE family toxin [Solimonas sp. K1W22B-7]AXQ27483.1 type II toxin-antitoxin system RelE/ParE family toxin [Solimonas sp. K1W22B-7]
MKVRITAEATRDLEVIADYIAQDNPSRALSFVQELRDKCLSLADTPLAFPLVPRYERFSVRRRVHGSYLIFYRVEAEQVVILHVLHGAMDYAGILFES